MPLEDLHPERDRALSFGSDSCRSMSGSGTRTWDQTAHAVTTYDLTWPGVAVQVVSTMDVTINRAGYDVAIETVATLDGAEASRRSWGEMVPRPV